jgi:hypothetical protein
MRDSLAVAANASVPYWMFASHVECDHQNGDAVSLAKGGGFQMGPSSWIGSSITGAGIGIGTGWLSNSYISGRINGNFKEGIAILGGTNARVIGAAITSNGNGAGHTYETRIGANVNDVRMVGNTISNLGDGDSSTDLGCILVEAGTGNHLNIRANGLGCSSTAIVNSASGTSNFVETAEAPSVSTLPTAAGAGGLYVCVDTAGLLYKKSACP